MQGSRRENRKSWSIKILADGVPLLEDESIDRGNARLEGKIRVDIYVPFGHSRYHSSSPSYELKLRIKHNTGVERTISAHPVVN